MSNSNTIDASSATDANDKVSPFHDAYFAPDPTDYSRLVGLHYSPELPDLPPYTRTVLDCACLYGNTSLACMYGWRFTESCEFWKKNVPLTDREREATLLQKRLKVIGVDGSASALNYSQKMNIIDEAIVQNFEHQVLEATKEALNEADVWVMQNCLSYMPLENMKVCIASFLADRSRPKRFIYDFNPYFDKRVMAPALLFDGYSGWTVVVEKFRKYRDKTEAEFLDCQENGWDMCVHHYVVDFAAM